MRARQLRAHLRNHLRVINGLRLLWIAVVLWFEVGAFVYSLSRCRWPDHVFRQADPSADPVHVLVVADPQVLDDKSLPGVSSLIRPFTRWAVDFNLRKSWRAAMKLHPQEIIFLGDMLNGGRYARDADEYTQFTARFKDIFNPPSGSKVHFVVGNHDVGLGKSRTFSSRARQHYQANFGPPNNRISIGNHTVLLLDSPLLVEEDYTRSAAEVDYGQWPGLTGGTIQFVKEVAKDIQNITQPTLLFTHIPLMRPERASCGPFREAKHGPKASIRKGAGDGYQNLLGRLTSVFLLEALQPTAIFSADDHDYCEFVHSHDQGQRSYGVREVTVKSISTITGLERPGIQLLSLWAPNGRSSASTTYADRLCLLPNQSFIHRRVYFPLAIISLLLLVYANTSQGSFLSPHRRSRGYSLTSGASETHNRYGRNVLGLGISPKLVSARPTSPTLWLRSPIPRSSSFGVPGNSPLHSPLLGPLLVPPTLDQDGEDEYPQVVTVNSHRRPSFPMPPSPLSSTWAATPLDREKFADADKGNLKDRDVEAGQAPGSTRNNGWFGVPSIVTMSRKTGLVGIGQQARPARWGFFSGSEREKDKRMERQGNWSTTSNIAASLTPNIGEGITSLASRTSVAIRLLKQFVIGREIAGGFWKRLAWGLLAAAWPPLLALAGIIMNLTR